MVGSGQPTDDFCGTYTKISFRCPNGPGEDSGHDHKKIKYNCKDPLCPICYPDIIKKDAVTITERLKGCYYAYRTLGYELGMPYHFIFSPPPEMRPLLATKDGFEAAVNEVYEICEELGLLGGTVVGHDTRGDLEEHDRARRGEIVLDPENHFHWLGFAPGFDARVRADPGLRPAAVREHHPGWIYKNKHARKHWGGVYRTMHYELTHAYFSQWVDDQGNDHRGKLYRYQGICAYNNMKTNIQKKNIEIICKRCGEQLHKYLEDEDQGPAFRKVTVKTYVIKPGVLDRQLERYPGVLVRVDGAELLDKRSKHKRKHRRKYVQNTKRHDSHCGI